MRNIKKFLSVLTSAAVAASFSLCAIACDNGEQQKEDATPVNTYEYDIPQDYCRTYYEIFVRSFADGNGDGTGDLRGLINNLDYLNDGDDSTTEDLGINGIWLMPIHPTGSYHGYDVTDYKGINPDYGTLADFDELVEECEKRGIWVQIDLVLNHTSKNHEWFKEALKEARRGTVEPEESEYMKMYEFYHKGEQPSTGTYYDAPNSDYVYLGNFSSDMPDLNLADRETNGLKEEIEDIVQFWIDHGVRSFRLDAVPWACANSVSFNAENDAFWSWFNDMCDEKAAAKFGKSDDGINRYCYNVGEVFDTAGLVTQQFFETGMSNFNFKYVGIDGTCYLTVAANNRNSAASGAALAVGMANLQKEALSKDENALLSNFISNHDMDRWATTSLFSGDVNKVKTAAGLYLLMPGNPYIYYGEEIGAVGSRGASNTDANRRLHFNWGDSRATQDPPGSNYSGTQKFGSMLDQTEDASSILTYYRRAIQLRNRFPEIGRGVMEAYAVNSDGKLEKAETMDAVRLFTEVNSLNKTIVAYTLEYKGAKTLVVHNVGDTVAKIDISDFTEYDVVGSVKANGGNVSLDGNAVKMSGSTVAVLKKA